MMWVEFVFWPLFVITLIVLLVVYLVSKKLSRLFYILSVFTYVMFILYWIDAYNLGKNAITSLLALSAALMIFIGHKVFRGKRE